MSDEPIGEVVLLVQHTHHLILVYQEDGGAARDRGRSPHADGLIRQTSFAEEVAGSQHHHDRLSPGLREHRELHAAVPCQNSIRPTSLCVQT